MSKALRVFCLLVGSYIVIASALVYFVPQYANSLEDRGLRRSDLTYFQKILIMASDDLKNLGPLILIVFVIFAAIISALVQMSSNRRQNAKP